jgi:hypothetical protein
MFKEYFAAIPIAVLPCYRTGQPVHYVHTFLFRDSKRPQVSLKRVYTSLPLVFCFGCWTMLGRTSDFYTNRWQLLQYCQLCLPHLCWSYVCVRVQQPTYPAQLVLRTCATALPLYCLVPVRAHCVGHSGTFDVRLHGASGVGWTSS